MTSKQYPSKITVEFPGLLPDKIAMHNASEALRLASIGVLHENYGGVRITVHDDSPHKREFIMGDIR